MTDGAVGGAALAGTAGFAAIARLGVPFEALLFRYMDRPERVDAATLRTIAAGIDFFHVLLKTAAGPSPLPDPSGDVLIVDNDPVCNRAATSALEQAQLRAYSMTSPLKAWEWLQARHFDLILLDVEMPELDGFELCHRLRRLPLYATTPVIYITVYSGFQTRASALLTGAEDFITKPIIPMHLALKALMYILKSRLPAPVARESSKGREHSAPPPAP